MAWTNPTAPNVMDFWTFCYANGITSTNLPMPVLSVTSGGSGYTTAPDVTIDPPSYGVDMTATATISGGVVTSLTLTNPGTNYASIPALTIAAPVSGTQATGVVTNLGSTWPASVLNQAMDRTINNTSGALIKGELGPYVKACYNLGFHLLLLFAPDTSYTVSGVNLTNGGSGYTSAPTVTFSAPSSGETATGYATINNGVVTGIILTYGGSGYTSAPTVTLSAPTSGTTATATASITGSFFAPTRTQYSLNQFRPGIVMAGGDQGSSQTFIVPHFFQSITLEALEVTKTPWGRQWLEYEQMYGQTVWDMT